MNDTDPRFRQAAIRILPDDVLLDMFSFYVDQADKEDEWYTLVHVCQRWRNVVFGSPRRLHLTLVYNPRKPVGEMLDVWPALPFVIIMGFRDSPGWEREVTLIDSIIGALEHHEPICRIAFSCFPALLLSRLAAGIGQPFPMLTSLQLSGVPHLETSHPNSFLGGSAPCLRILTLIGISFPALPNLLLSASDLVHLDLWDIPNSAYIPPNEMVVCLSALKRLKTLYLGFRSNIPGRKGRCPPLLTRTVLHALTTLWFSGDTKYLEDIISQIHAPLLNDIDITLFDLSTFHAPQFVQFISRTEMLNALNRATVRLHRSCVEVTLSSDNLRVDQPSIRLRASWLTSYLQLIFLVPLCRSCLPLPLLSILEYLDIYVHVYHWQHDAHPDQWLELLGLFTSVKSLSLFDGLILPVMTALGGLVGGRVLEVLPVLQNVHLHWGESSAHLQKSVAQFVAARKLSGHPVAIHNGEPREWLKDASGGRRPLESARRFLSN